jgi:hypothetical protein
MWNSINKLIDPNFKAAPSGLRRDSKNKRRGKGPNNKKRKARDEKRSFGKRRQDRSSSFRDKSKSYAKVESDKAIKRWRKKVLVLKENQVLLKKINQNQMVLQTIQSISKENLQKIHLQTQRKKVLVLKVRKNLRVEIADLKILALKNIVKKELDLKIF